MGTDESGTVRQQTIRHGAVGTASGGVALEAASVKKRGDVLRAPKKNGKGLASPPQDVVYAKASEQERDRDAGINSVNARTAQRAEEEGPRGAQEPGPGPRTHPHPSCHPAGRA